MMRTSECCDAPEMQETEITNGEGWCSQCGEYVRFLTEEEANEL